MREILFRGKRVDNGEWVEGDLIQLHETADYWYILPNGVSGEMYEKEPYTFRKNDVMCEVALAKIISETVGQYTGLTDKNGKKIFEGDIVKTTLGITRIVFDKCRGFGGYSDQKRKTGGLIYLQGIDLAFGEIIGNIHDNPELLK